MPPKCLNISGFAIFLSYITVQETDRGRYVIKTSHYLQKAYAKLGNMTETPETPVPPATTAQPPRVIFGEGKGEIAMPGEPTANGQKIPSIIGDEDERKKVFGHFQDMWAKADEPPPTFKAGDDAREFKTKLEAYQKNPMYKIRHVDAGDGQSLDEKYESYVKHYGKEQADILYKDDVQQLANQYMDGADRGARDPEVDKKRNSAFSLLMSGNFMGAIKEFFLTIPWVGDFMAASGKWAMAKFRGEKMTFAEARRDIQLEKIYGGAAAKLNVNADYLVDDGKRFDRVGATADPEAPPVTPPATENSMIELDGTFAKAKDQLQENPIIKEMMKKGQIKFNGETASATREGLHRLDGVNGIEAPTGLPAKEGNSYAKIE